MSTRNLIRAIQKLPRRTRKLSARLTKGFFTWLLRRLYVLWHRPTTSTSGFVLPTTILLLLMVALTAGALTYRSFSRSEQAIAKRQQQVITNSATPAINRAQSKLEFLFQEDERFPGGVPSSEFLLGMILDDGSGVVPQLFTGVGNTSAENPYTLPDETQLDINNDGNLDPAWSFNSDINKDGTIGADEIVVYSILANHEAADPVTSNTKEINQGVDIEKARALVTRNGPISTTEAGTNCPGSTRSPGLGWQLVGAALQKNFQIDAFVLNDSDVSRTVETLEFQQARETAQGNKWGAWFRYDLETFPGADLNWNGAMHSEGSFFLRDDFNTFLVSSHNSCVFDESEITLGEHDAADNGGTAFEGQLVSGRLLNDNFGGEDDPTFHIYIDDDTAPAVPGTGLTAATDSVDGSLDPSEIALNPIKLFTEGIYEHNNAANNSSHDAGFDGSNLNRRIYPDGSNNRLDDSYRADDRWGPIATYDIGPTTTVNVQDVGKDIGEPITSSDPGGDDVIDNGADGYWERQTIPAGLRLIVGQRFDFGNAFGWRTDSPVAGNRDPLYPATDYGAQVQAAGTAPGNNAAPEDYPGQHESLQYRTLRDNLAAVQGMVVYHYEGGGSATDGTTPLACYALTAHPGTRYTVGYSRTFEDYGIDPTGAGGAGPLKVDFLSGHGTNGWEFDFPISLPSELDTALQNLADMTGDPLGGAPSFQATQAAAGGDIHPNPDLTMWGDFSMLNRVLAAGNGSPADESTEASAACTLGLLAYNIDTLNDLAAGVIANPADTNYSPYTLDELADAVTAVVASPPAGTTVTDLANYTSEQWFNPAAGQGVTNTDGPLKAEFDANAGAEELFVMMSQKLQVDRDRKYGFKTDVGLPAAGGIPVGTYLASAKTYTSGASITAPYSSATTYSVSCDPNSFTGTGDEARRLSLAIALCPPVTNTAPYISETQAVVRYPALFYVFPVENHDLDGAVADDNDQPAEDYVDNNLTSSAATTYEEVSDADLDTIAADFQPRAIGSWVLPAPTVASANDDLVLDEIAGVVAADPVYDPNDDRAGYDPLDPQAEDITISYKDPVTGDTDVYSVALVDKGMFDGRENMSVRVLDLDLSLLTTDTNGTDFWITGISDGAQGLVYAFREDAVREDTIVRPTGAAWGSCDTVAELTSDTCYSAVFTDTLAAAPQDPPLNDVTGISAKPVDFYPDPMRRPYGFRLKNGIDLSAPSGSTLQREVGMTFVTDNSVYIQGDFNLHSTDGTIGGLLEEFTQTLGDGSVAYDDEFYDDRITLNEADFAALANDHWRPTEILADAITILSENFRDGSIDDTFRMPSTTTRGDGKSSYTNQNRPYFTGGGNFNDEWTRENPLDDRTYISHGGTPPGNTHLPINSPVLVPADGDYWESNFAQRNSDRLGYYDAIVGANIKSERYNNQMAPTTTYVNAVLISGIVPSRSRQSYGGLHNFPRLLEDWGLGGGTNRQNLFITGAFFQFNFSTAATGPYDHDAWEPGITPTNDEWNVNYTAPGRRWGYDVGLLYVPPAPISSRFANSTEPRSEYYRELPADEPYMMLLRCARPDGTNRVDPTADSDPTSATSCTGLGL
ncbi:MAG: hormogonium polysaccharide biosynthesis protein HpsA [Cyanobacteria bacterium J06639_16]